jgi:hypothetical protein
MCGVCIRVCVGVCVGVCVYVCVCVCVEYIMYTCSFFVRGAELDLHLPMDSMCPGLLPDNPRLSVYKVSNIIRVCISSRFAVCVCHRIRVCVCVCMYPI